MRKTRPFSSTSLILLIVFAFFWPLLIILGATATCSATGAQVNWKVVTAFAAIYNVVWLYGCYRGARVILVRREAEKKQRTSKAMKEQEQ
jgi:membrane protein implicated in regulation of membrane protease activity